MVQKPRRRQQIKRDEKTGPNKTTSTMEITKRLKILGEKKEIKSVILYHLFLFTRRRR